MLAANEVTMSGSENKANKDTSNNNFSEHIRDFLYKMCNWEVSRCRRAKCTKKRAALAKLFFLLIRTIAIFAVLVAVTV